MSIQLLYSSRLSSMRLLSYPPIVSFSYHLYSLSCAPWPIILMARSNSKEFQNCGKGSSSRQQKSVMSRLPQPRWMGGAVVVCRVPAAESNRHDRDPDPDQ
jgi:hypothetical protein